MADSQFEQQSEQQPESNTYPLVICLMGPTCSGKTALAIELAQSFPVEIINVDSALVYAGLDIGAAKPSDEELARAPHRLLGFRDPAQPYSAAQFRQDAIAEIEDILANGRIPLLVGGTMLYFKALQEGLADLPSADPELRARLDARAAEEGWPALHAELAKVDPQSAERLKPNDSQRIGRALEVYELTGKSLTEHHLAQKKVVLSDSDGRISAPFPYRVVNIALAPNERSELHARIATRFHAMLDAGFIDEVKALRARGDLHLDLPCIKAVGYRQVWEYLDGKWRYDEMIEKGIIATRQLAKRQFTWLRGWPNLHWFDSDDPQRVTKVGDLLASELGDA